MNVANYRLNAVFPQIEGIALVLRDASGIAVVKMPSWWTVRRLSYFLLAALASVAGLAGWNFWLRRLVERRGKQLFSEQVGRMVSEFKVAERTRLSTDLHDTLSQNLSGVSMQLSAVRRHANSGNRDQLLKHLDVSIRTLQSSRNELRNMLGDLRSRLLDEPDFEKALHQLLDNLVYPAAVRIRFPIRRERVSDTTANALFCIFRELASNAVNHGKAKTIRIAGAVRDSQLLCSVTDDGSGFDVSSAPGVAEGHFGLQGVGERIAALNGKLSIRSEPERGAKIVFTIPIPEAVDLNL